MKYCKSCGRIIDPRRKLKRTAPKLTPLQQGAPFELNWSEKYHDLPWMRTQSLILAFKYDSGKNTLYSYRYHTSLGL